MKLKYLALGIFLVLVIAGCPALQPIVPQERKGTSAQGGKQPIAAEKTQAAQLIAPDIKDLLGKSSTRVKSLSYMYKGPESPNDAIAFMVKGNKVKYIPPRMVRSLDLPDAIDSLFIDTAAKTAKSYCDALPCKYRGLKQNLSYSLNYIMTPLDWNFGIKDARKIGEEVIESRSTWKIETDKGTMWIDDYYGIPFKVVKDGKEYRFSNMAINKVTDDQVVPSSG